MLRSPALKPITSPPSTAGTASSQPAGRVPPISAVVLALLRAYKLTISPFFAGSCRFHPSCADYMADAVRCHGAGRGVWFGLRRLARCRPLGGHGYDPVPPR
jgi:putative membrane protein insertion efficiency factor